MASLIPYDYTNLKMDGVDNEKYFITLHGLSRYISNTILRDATHDSGLKQDMVHNYLNEINASKPRMISNGRFAVYNASDVCNAMGFDLKDLLSTSNLDLYLDEDDIREVNSEWDA